MVVLSLFCTAFGVALFTQRTSAQFPPSLTDVKLLKTPGNPDAVVRYKEPSSKICQTKNPNQKQYTGYVHLPPSTLEDVTQDYEINTFFWFVEAQKNPHEAPLTIWLNGGPGSSSMLGMMNEVGPCKPMPVSRDSITTTTRDFSWDEASNMLFIDQPNQVGFSYDEAINGSLALLDVNGHFTPGELAPAIENQLTFDYLLSMENKSYIDAVRSTRLINGTFPSGNQLSTENTTEVAARAAWCFLQSWLKKFPQYNPNSTGVNLFAESYGGHYGPEFFSYFEKQNERRQSGILPANETVELHLHSLGIINGCIDAEIQTPYWPMYAYENPYGIQAISKQDRDLVLAEWSDPFTGCKRKIQDCNRLMKHDDPKSLGGSPGVNLYCNLAKKCSDDVMEVYRRSNRNFYDIANGHFDSFPPSYHLEYLNNATVQQAIGSRVNFTESNKFVYKAFASTGDCVRGGQLDAISYLLRSGVRVAMLYGDRDYICNYQGGEAVSSAVPTFGQELARSGYTDLIVDGEIAGRVREAGNFSFSRIYQAGHLVPAYQPEAMFNIFTRIINRVSIATGKEVDDFGNFTTDGPVTNLQLDPPDPNPPMCYLRDISSCNSEEKHAIGNREVTVINGVVYLNTSDYDEPKPLLENTHLTHTHLEEKQKSGLVGSEEVEGASTQIKAPSLVALLVAILFLVRLL